MDITTLKTSMQYMLILLFLSSSATGQFTDCLQANRTCHQDQKCHLLLTVLPRQCGDGLDRQGEACSPLQIQYCSQSLRDILQFNHFQTCQCPHNMPNYEECEAFRESVFLHKCAEISQEGGQYLVKAHAADSNSYDSLYDGADDNNRPSLGGSDCLEMRKTCQSQRLCSRDLTAFRQHCKVRGGRCYAETREACIGAYEALRPSGMFHCSCDGDRKQSRRKCNGILNRFAKNACLVVANEAAIQGREDKKLPAIPRPDGDASADSQAESRTTTNANDGSEPDPGGLSDADYELWIDEVDPDDDDRTTATPTPQTDVSCYTAFSNCNADNICRLKVGKFLTACQLDLATKSCDRQACLPAMNSFFQTVDMKHAHAAAFCTCEPDDRQCHSLKSVLQPQCAEIEIPTPSCMFIYRKCMADDTCRKRYEYYDTYCEEDRRTGDCANSQSMCRDAVVGLMGTVLMTNCTCDYEVAINRCKTVRKRLHNNRCRVASMASLHVNTITPQSWPVATTITALPNFEPTTQSSQILVDEKQTGIIKSQVDVPTTTRGNSRGHEECWRRRGSERHQLIRIYPNQTDCSELCHCLVNGTLTCQALTCPSKRSCRIEGLLHAHSAMFILSHRGQCQCSSGEAICTKSGLVAVDDGVYLFVGYSLDDMLVLANHSVKISYAALSQKLTYLINGERSIDTCTVSRYANTPGNIVFRIDTLRTTKPGRPGSRSSASSTLDSNQAEGVHNDPEEGCFFKAKLLEIMINGRQEPIASDPELSVIRLASVETIRNKAQSRKSGAQSINAPYTSWLFVVAIAISVTLFRNENCSNNRSSS